MKEIFTDLYKKVVGFFQTQEKENEHTESKNVACNRLKLVLMQDRTNLTPFLLERMRGEMIDVLSKYVEMDKEALELNFEQEGEQMALMLSIPVLRAKEEDEIKAIIDEEERIKKEQEAKESEDETGDETDSETDSESEEESEETDEDETEVEDIEEEIDVESEEISESPDQIEEELEEEASNKKSKKRN